MKKIMIIAGRTHPKLAQSISDELNVEEAPLQLTKRIIKDFNNGEINPEVKETVAGAELFLIQTSTTGNVNNDLQETLLIIDALKRARSKKVFLVQALYPYERQDRRETNRKNRPKRKSIAARVIADQYMSVNLDGIITVELHAEQIEGFFPNNCIVENIDPSIIFKDYLLKEGIIKEMYEGKKPTIVAPDTGAATRARNFSEMLGLSAYAIIDKNRTAPGVSEAMYVIGDCKDRDCIIYDDMIDTGTTAIKSAEKLKEEGANKVYLLAAHGVFSGSAIDKLANSSFEKIIITDSVPNPAVDKYPGRFVVLPLAEMLAQVISNIHNSESLQPIVNTDQEVEETTQ
ncbi:MAG TPA: ribose-phosphate diphosphokinase [Candidatus Paceibacterota bacterium]|nr:ribose-phosphate diphosphokinase [Candidatus Paceibacterota bacterium]